jgi:hypothetical protein
MTLDPVWPAYILARKAQLAGDMHDPVHAVGLARAAAATARNGNRARLSGVAAAYQAQGHALAGDIDAAAAGGLTALNLAQATSSGRIITELRRLDSAVARHRTHGTAALHEALTTVIRQPRRT